MNKGMKDSDTSQIKIHPNKSPLRGTDGRLVEV